jgi:Icc-related predicted phosphoesterase
MVRHGHRALSPEHGQGLCFALARRPCPHSKHMRFLLVSDLHYALKQFDWVHRVAGDFDLVVIAGDHLDIAGTVDLRAQMSVMLTYFRRLQAKTRLILCSGNHDLDGSNALGEKTARWIDTKVRRLGIPTDGDAFSFAGVLFTICPWWDGPKTRALVGEQLARDAAAAKDAWVWVYHSPPDASPTGRVGQKDFGDSALREWITQYQPAVVLSGHIHQAPFRQDGSWVDRIGSTWVFNPGRQIGDCPTHVICDTEQQMALWFSLAGAEAIRLDEPLPCPVPELTELPAWLR